jgi:hypothetical protein
MVAPTKLSVLVPRSVELVLRGPGSPAPSSSSPKASSDSRSDGLGLNVSREPAKSASGSSIVRRDRARPAGAGLRQWVRDKAGQGDGGAS